MPPHQVLPDVTRGGLGSLSKMQCSASSPSPCQSNPGTKSCRESSRGMGGILQESLQGEMLNEPAATLGRRGPVLRFTHTFQTTCRPDPFIQENPTQFQEPIFSIHEGEGQSFWFQTQGSLGFTWLSYPCSLTEACLPLKFYEDWSIIYSKLEKMPVTHFKPVSFEALWHSSGPILYFVMARCSIFEETFGWTQKQSNKCTIKLSPWQWESPWSCKPGWMPISLMALLSVREVLQQKKVAAAYCTWPMRCSPRVQTSTWILWKYSEEHHGSCWDWGVEKVPRDDCTLVTKGADLKVPGNFSSGITE